MWELDYKESWTLKNWCFRTVVLEMTLESPLGCKEIHPVHPKGDQFWIFIGRTDGEAETPMLWPPDAKDWLIGKDPDAGKDWRQEEKGMTENELVGWHHRLNEHEFEWTLWVGDGLGVLLQSVGSQGVRHDWATNWTELNWPVHETLKCLLQHHNLKASNLWCSAFFMVQPAHLYTTTGKTIALTIQTFVKNVMSLLFNMLSRFWLFLIYFD